MEHLSDEQRKAISKMNVIRLASSLRQIGFSVSDLEGMDKPAMVQAWALAVHEGRDKPEAGVKAEVKSEVSSVDLERQRLEFEMRKWEAEQLRQQQLAEEARQEREAERQERAAERLRQENRATSGSPSPSFSPNSSS